MSDSRNPKDLEDLLPVPTTEKDVALYRPGDFDPLVQYIREISKYELIPIEQELALAKALKETGDIEYAKKLVQANLRLVVKIAMEYRRSYSQVLDLIQEGNIGLMKAVSKYDPDKGAKLSYYASWWIRSYILKFILDNFRLIKIGTTAEQKKLFYNLMKEKNRLEGLGITPDNKMIGENLGVSEKSVDLMQERLGERGGELSFELKMGDDESTQLSDLLALDEDGPEKPVEKAQSMEILQDHLEDFLEQLNERDRDVFTKRLLSEVPPSLQSIANDYGVSRERIRQIEERLLNKLKEFMSAYLR